MEHSVYIEDFARPESKRDLRDAIKLDPGAVMIEDAAHYGLAQPRPAQSLAEGEIIFVVGPDPYAGDVSFTAEITRRLGQLVVR